MLAAARSSFGSKGYAQTSVDEIAAAARVTKGAVYHHFAGKEALFRAVHAEVEGEAEARAVAARDPAGSPIDQIVPYAASGPLSAKLLKNGTLKTYRGFPHGMPTTEADTINADLLAFLQS